MGNIRPQEGGIPPVHKPQRQKVRGMSTQTPSDDTVERYLRGSPHVLLGELNRIYKCIIPRGRLASKNNPPSPPNEHSNPTTLRRHVPKNPPTVFQREPFRNAIDDILSSIIYTPDIESEIQLLRTCARPYLP